MYTATLQSIRESDGNLEQVQTMIANEIKTLNDFELLKQKLEPLIGQEIGVTQEE